MRTALDEVEAINILSVAVEIQDGTAKFGRMDSKSNLRYISSMAPMKRFQNVAPEKRAAILDAGAAEISEHGLGGASINRVIAAAGMSKSSFYHYFEGKDDLYGAVTQRALDELLAAMVPPALPTTIEEYWSMWEVVYVGFLRRQLADPVLAALNWSAIQSRADGTAHPALEILAGQMRQWLTGMIAQGQALAAVRTDVLQDLLLNVTFGMLEGGDRWFATHWDEIAEDKVDIAAARVVRLLRDLTEPRGDTK
jgi:TetR/AcrR family transcriptional regulator, transcriptional repressor of aconitase